MSKNRIDNILPDDGKLFDRVKIFSELCEKYTEIDDENETQIKVRDIPYFESDKESVLSSNNSEEEFEDKSVADEDQDPDFDVRKTLDDTLQIVQKRENNWRQNGIVKAMETFNINVSEKVQNWIQDNNSYYSIKCNQFSKPLNHIGSELKLFDEFHIRNHEIISEDESLQSVNTAKYILSNRKKLPHRIGKNYISGHFTAMTIKQFCCYNRQQSLSNDVNQYHKRQSNKSDLDSVFKGIKNSPENKKYPIKITFNKENEKSPYKLRKKVKFKRKNKYPNSSYSLESSTDTTDQSILDQNYKTKPKLISKSQNMYRKEKHSHSSKQSCESSLDFDLNNVRQKIRNKKPLVKENKAMHISSQSDINFNVDNIINSTEINNSKNLKIKSLGDKNIDKSKYKDESTNSTYSSDESNLNNNIKRKHQKVKKLYKTSPKQNSTNFNEYYVPLQKTTNERSNLCNGIHKNKKKLENIKVIPKSRRNQTENSLINFESSNTKVCNKIDPKDRKQNIKQFQQILDKSLSDTNSSDSSLFLIHNKNSGEKTHSKTKKKYNIDSELSNSLKTKDKNHVSQHAKHIKLSNLNTIIEESLTPEKFSKSSDKIAKCGKENFSRSPPSFNKKVKVKVKRLELKKEKGQGLSIKEMIENKKLLSDKKKEFNNKKTNFTKLHSENFESFKSLSEKTVSDAKTECQLPVKKKPVKKHDVSKNLSTSHISKGSPFPEKCDTNKKCRTNPNTLKNLNKNKLEQNRKQGLHKECISNSLHKTNNEKMIDFISLSDDSKESINISKKLLKKNNEYKYSELSRRLSTQSLQSNSSTNNKSLFRKSFNSREPHIVLHDPDDEDHTIKCSENSNEDIIINESTLESKIGLSLTKKFLNGRKFYKKNFNRQSTIIFILPNEPIVSNCTESEIDELEQTFENTQNKTGKIVEVRKYKHCNDYQNGK